MLLASCSRMSWAHAIANVSHKLASLGAADPPSALDDAYALVGVKGGKKGVPLAEARTPCCVNPDPVCGSCDQTPAVAAIDTAEEHNKGALTQNRGPSKVKVKSFTQINHVKPEDAGKPRAQQHRPDDCAARARQA